MADPPDPKLGLYTLEYQTAAGRYDNIFKAVWQIFSYMTFISGAVLTFGGDRFQANLLWVVATLPLVFWYLATFEPLNHYGVDTAERLAAIEGILNHDFGVQMAEFSGFQARSQAKGLVSFLRVHYVVRLFFIPLIVFSICQAGTAICKSMAGTPMMIHAKKTAEVKIVTESADELEKQLRIKLVIPPDQTAPPSGGAPSH